MTDKYAVSARLCRLCRQKGLSYYNLADSSGVPLTTVMNIIKGKTKNPGILTVFRLCDGLGVSVMEFFEGEEFVSDPSSGR